MMEEVSTTAAEESTEGAAQIASQLEEAALTNVTQAEESRKSPSPSPAVSSAASSLPPPSQLPLTLSSPVGATPVSTTFTPTISTPTSNALLPESVTRGQSSPIMFGTPLTASRDSTPGVEVPPPAYTAPASGPPPVAPSSFIPLDPAPPSPAVCEEPIGPVYPSPGDAQQGGGGGGGGLLGWIGSGFVKGVVERTKTGMESMITTLDPGMKEVIYSGGDLDLVVASDKDVKVGAVRDAFQEVFGHATVNGLACQPSSIAPQPVGYTAGLKGAEERLEALRQNTQIQDDHILVAVENFIAELLPDQWYDIGCLLLKDRARRLELCVYTQAVPVPSDLVARAQDATPQDFGPRWSGLKVTVGQCFAEDAAARGEQISPSDWHLQETGISRRTLIHSAAKTLAGLYKRKTVYT